MTKFKNPVFNNVIKTKVGIALTSVLIVVSVSGCGGSKVQPVKVTLEEDARSQYVVLPAEVPQGVVRYCWEEPMVAREHNGPGLNTEGTFYSPAYTALRQVRGGKWRPCDELEAASDGGTK
jgi:hypothetical protein